MTSQNTFESNFSSEGLLNSNSIGLNNEEKDEKINKMLDSYFRNEKAISKPFKINEHLFIDLIEFRNIADELGEFGVDHNSKSVNSKYYNLYERINEAKIYPGEYDPKPRSDPLRFLSACFLIALFFYVPLILTKQITIPSILLYIIGFIYQFFFMYKIGLFSLKQLKEKDLIKLEKIFNAKPCLELYYKNECIYTIQFHSYADISGIQCSQVDDGMLVKVSLDPINLGKIGFYYFHLNYLYFVDSTREYFKFLVGQWSKYCYLSNNGYREIYSKMYLKFSLITIDNEIIYKNDPIFCNKYTTINIIFLWFLFIIFALLQLTGIIYLILKLFTCYIIDIKKTVSIKHNLEEYINLDYLFPKVTNKTIKRVIHEVISERETIQKEFIQMCVDLTEKTRKFKQSQLELEGYLIPFSVFSGLYVSKSYNIECFYDTYGTKVEKILGIKPSKIFRKFNISSYDNELSYFNDDDENDENEDDYNDRKAKINTKHSSSNTTGNVGTLKEVIYKEKVLSLKCKINKQTVMVDYNIILPNHMNNPGKFNLKKPLSNGFDILQEKINQEWTKSEIYIPGCVDVIEIIRKKRAIRIIVGGKIIVTSETALNDEIHAGASSWLNENDWDQRTINKFVGNCIKVSPKNRFQTNYY